MTSAPKLITKEEMHGLLSKTETFMFDCDGESWLITMYWVSIVWRVRPFRTAFCMHFIDYVIFVWIRSGVLWRDNKAFPAVPKLIEHLRRMVKYLGKYYIIYCDTNLREFGVAVSSIVLSEMVIDSGYGKVPVVHGYFCCLFQHKKVSLPSQSLATVRFPPWMNVMM